MSNIVPFNFEGMDVQTVDVDGRPWFIADDVCTVLDIDRDEAVEALGDGEKAGVTISDTRSNGLCQKRRVTIVNKIGLHELVSISTATCTQRFLVWIRNEVHPSFEKMTSNVVPLHEFSSQIEEETTAMNEISLFNFNGLDVRITDQNGDPWFVARDVCQILDLPNIGQAISRLDEDEKNNIIISDVIPRRGKPTSTIISESGLYSLILTSRKPDARKFKKWVTSEVLPSIRKTKSYSLDRQAYLREALHDVPSLQFLVHECTVKIQTLQDEANENKPKLEAFERITASDDTICITDAAKILDMRPRDLFDFLSYKRWIYKRTGCRHWVAYQEKIQQGLLEHKTTEVTHSDGSPKTAQQVRITQKGLSKLATMQEPQALMIH